jgi:hypothetical protein
LNSQEVEMGAGGVVVIAAAAHRKRLQQVIDRFRVAEATAPDRARILSELGVADSGELDELIDADVIRSGTAPDTWFLDEAAYIAKRDAPVSRTGRVVAAFAALIVVMAAVMLGFVLRARG